MDNLNDGITETAEPAEAEETKAATVPEKFRDVKTLIKAYTDLEAEFTRRSQRLKELEEGNKATAAPDGVDGAPSPVKGEDFVEAAKNDARVRDAVIRDYLKELTSLKSVPVLSGGGIAAAPPAAPSSVREAGRLAREFLNK